ncbi:hypothetical protein O0L34_g17194 [Tuta absoluta]|nr:hypothetical protein O0L34_g17194 [Tuta absoluta]
MSEDIKSDNSRTTEKTTIQIPRPSSPRKFFARLYGHLEEPKPGPPVKDTQGYHSESSSDVEVEDAGSDRLGTPPLWTPPPPMPLYPRPMLLPHQQLAFGAGLAAFCK